ncbi:MAG TPA: hypothetical protein VFH47_00405 [Candidatus Thermoplasmatota archaeon]|nr:hypothetical protein [Candidatus Thermoplasmatota archaeon]
MEMVTALRVEGGLRLSCGACQASKLVGARTPALHDELNGFLRTHQRHSPLP